MVDKQLSLCVNQLSVVAQLVLTGWISHGESGVVALSFVLPLAALLSGAFLLPEQQLRPTLTAAATRGRRRSRSWPSVPPPLAAMSQCWAANMWTCVDPFTRSFL